MYSTLYYVSSSTAYIPKYVRTLSMRYVVLSDGYWQIHAFSAYAHLEPVW